MKKWVVVLLILGILGFLVCEPMIEAEYYIFQGYKLYQIGGSEQSHFISDEKVLLIVSGHNNEVVVDCDSIVLWVWGSNNVVVLPYNVKVVDQAIIGNYNKIIRV